MARPVFGRGIAPPGIENERAWLRDLCALRVGRDIDAGA